MGPAAPPASSTGSTSERSELPTITKRAGSTRWRAITAPYVRAFFSDTISTAEKSSPSRDDALPLGRGPARLGELDRRLDHRQREPLHAVAEVLEVADRGLVEPAV